MTGRWINSADSHVYEPYELWSTPLGKKWGETVPRFLDSPVGETRRTYFNGEIYLPEDDFVGDSEEMKAKVKRAMWSRRAQEYEQKINSGDLISIAEVVRDLHRNDDQREQSYSERQLYEAALERLTREVAAVSGGDEVAAAKQVDEVLTSRAA